MNVSDWDEIKKTFATVSELPKAERAAYLSACPAELGAAVGKLLEAEDEAGDFILEAAIVGVGLNPDGQPDSFVGKQIDSYKLLKEIGQGGMGAVYLAKRSDESFDKEVAIKLIKRGMDTNAVLKRFVLERQILANLEHPNIARLLDGGSTVDGLPYLVMEYVEGLPVTRFCNSREFDTRNRLDLFQKICAAVSYAHTNLVVHRDLKPSNILVTEDGSPKLLDFGIAKLLHPDWSLDTAEATATMFRVMTPQYASPEQIRGLPVTTASDVYSLGVVLYELLTGERPYKMDGQTPDELAQIVITAEPVRPSSVVSRPILQGAGSATNEEASHGTTDDGRASEFRMPDTSLRSLRGDLDNIILKALRKEPERRYPTVQEFSEDIRRHLAGLPVTASADTATYRLSKFVKRHRIGILVTSIILITMLVATGAIVRQSFIASRERDKAEQRFEEVRKLTRTIVFDYYDQIIKLPGSTPILEKMVQDTLLSLDKLEVEGSDDAGLQSEIARAYQKIGDVQGNPYQGNLGNIDGAIESYQKALAIGERLVAQNPNDADLQRNLAKSYESSGDMLWTIGEYVRAHENYSKSFAIHEKLSASDPTSLDEAFEVARAHHRIGQALSRIGEIDAARENFQLGKEKFAEILTKAPTVGKYRRGMGGALCKVGDMAAWKGDWKSALENHRGAFDIWSDLSAKEPTKPNLKRDVAIAANRLAIDLAGLGEVAEALKIGTQSVEIQEAIAMGDPQNVQYEAELGLYYVTLGSVQAKLKDWGSAQKNLTGGLSILERVTAAMPRGIDQRRDLALSYQTVGDAYQGQGEHTAAAEYYRRSAELLETDALRNELRAKLAENYESISRIRARSGDPVEAGTWHERSLDVWKK